MVKPDYFKLTEFICEGNLDHVRIILEHEPRQISTELLVLALEYDQLEVAQLLIDSGAKLEEHIHRYIHGESVDILPLSCAILLDHKFASHHGPPSLSLAEQEALKEKRVRFLLRQGANPEGYLYPCDDTGKVKSEPLGSANFNAYLRLTVDSKPLHLAVLAGYSTILETLIDVGKAEVDSRDYNKNTPLHLAVIAQRWEIVSLLISRNADPTIKNTHNISPLDIANKISSGIETRFNTATKISTIMQNKLPIDTTPNHSDMRRASELAQKKGRKSKRLLF